MKPLIFLDFDGVLNTYHTYGHYPGEKAIDPDKVERLHKLVEEFDAEVVISSAWRKVHKLCELRRMLRDRGGLPSSKVIGVTPDRTPPGSSWRGNEILDWLDTTNRVHNPFVILDDLSAKEFGGLESHFVQTTLKDGFTDERLEYARACLKRQIEKSQSDR